jgi:hypothetical protein
MCANLGVGTQFSASYAHHMLGKVERLWDTNHDCDYASMHIMPVPMSMWSCAMSTAVHLRNRIFSGAVSTCGGVSFTLLTPASPDASGFHMFGCTAFAKVPDAQREKLDPKSIHGVFVGIRPTIMVIICTNLQPGRLQAMRKSSSKNMLQALATTLPPYLRSTNGQVKSCLLMPSQLHRLNRIMTRVLLVSEWPHHITPIVSRMWLSLPRFSSPQAATYVLTRTLSPR